MNVDFSIIIPVVDRKRLDETLAALAEDRRRYKRGKTEVIVLDGGEDGISEELAAVQASCKKYGAEYIFCADTEKGKRLRGVNEAKNNYILFIDSDAEICLGTLDEHSKIYEGFIDEGLGGVCGVTKLIAPKPADKKLRPYNIKALEYAECMAAYRQAAYKQRADFILWNNSSFPKKVLTEVGMPDGTLSEQCADEKDFCCRALKSGYKFMTAPQAEAAISCADLDKKGFKELIKRRATADYHVGRRHPELLHKPLPSVFFVCIMILAAAFIASVITAFIRPLISWLPFSIAVLYCVVMLIVSFFTDTAYRVKGSSHKEKDRHEKNRKKRNIVHYVLGKIIDFKYKIFISQERKLNKDRNRTGFMLFSVEQAKYEYERQTKKIKLAVIILAGMIILALIAVRIFKGVAL